MKRFFLFLLAFVVFLSIGKVNQVFAGTDIQVSCTLSNCTSTPNNVPLFNESNIWPGYIVTQNITATNTTNQNGLFGMDAEEVVGEGSSEQELQALVANSLASNIFVIIRQGTANGPVVYGANGTTTLQDLYDAGQINLGFINAGQTDKFFLKATLDPQAGNEVMASSTIFNFDAGFQFTPVPPDGPPGGGGGGGGNGGTSPANPPVCSDTKPSGRPTLSIASISGSQVNLSWTAVAGADHYAIVIGTTSGNYIYGNNNVGNVTSYTVTGLTPGGLYFFQVIPINGCAPGNRSNEVSTNGTPATGVVNPPTGFAANQVLGATTDATAEAEAAKNGENAGSILGDETACNPLFQYLPLIFLIIQLVTSFIVYVIFRSPENRTKQIIVVVTDLVLTALFYFLRNCDCSSSVQSFLGLLCQWYIIVAIAAALITQFINYALIEREE